MTEHASASKAQPLAGAILTVLAALLIAGVASFAGPCEAHGGEEPMSCLWAARAVLGMGAAIAIISLVRIFERDEGERRGLSFASGLLGLLAAATPGLLIELCTDPAMRCNAVMRPFVLIAGAAIALVGLGDLTRRLLALRKR